MTVAILEVDPHGHYPYVESVARIYASQPNNSVLIFTTPAGQAALQHLRSNRVGFETIRPREPYAAFFQRLRASAPDRLFVVTLEAYAKVPYQIMRAFLATPFECPIYCAVHNVNAWFAGGTGQRLRAVFYQLPSLPTLVYRARVHFEYARLYSRVVAKVRATGGRLVVVSSAVARELARHVPAETVTVVPFSVHDPQFPDRSATNDRLRVCVPGFLSATRRDYDSLWALLDGELGEALKRHVAWDLLGGVAAHERGQEVMRAAQQHRAAGHCLYLYDRGWVEFSEFDDSLSRADVVLGNLHLRQGSSGRYGQSKDSGVTFAMVKAAKPGLLPAAYEPEESLRTAVVPFGSYPELAQILLHWAKNPAELTRLKQRAAQNARQFTPSQLYQRLV